MHDPTPQPRKDRAVYADFEQVHNYFERLVFEEIIRRSNEHPEFTKEMLNDVACVALNHLPARYVRHDVDLVFYLTEQERRDIEQTLDKAMTDAFQYVGDWVERRGNTADTDPAASAPD